MSVPAKPRPFTVGEPVPWFECAASNGKPNYNFGTVAGRYIMLSFLGAPDSEAAQLTMKFVLSHQSKFGETRLAFFGVMSAVDPNFTQDRDGIRCFWDTDGKVAELFRTAGEPGTYVLDSMLRVLAYVPYTDERTHHGKLIEIFSRLTPLGSPTEPHHAPVLVLPRVFEPSLCRTLIDLYRTNGGTPSGYMREVDGRTVPVLNPNFKRRTDFPFDQQNEYAKLREQIRMRLTARLVPEIAKSFQFKATRIERYVVACYSDTDQGFFNPHRDNTTPGTAHRRFACTINLNAEDYEGGELRFPEFGPRTYRAPTGGAVVFSCSLLHEATPVTKGERFAFLPFFYDEEAAVIRRQNHGNVATDPIIEG